MKTKLLTLALFFSITISAQVTKTEAFTTGTKLAFYIGQCGNTIPEAVGKLSFCDRNNNLGVVERSYGLSDRRALSMFPNYFNDDEYYVTGNGLSIRNADGTWENIPNIAVPLWGSQYLPTIQTGLVLPNGKVVIQASNAGILLNIYNRNLKTFTAVDFPNNKYPQQVVYDEDRNLTWAFASSGNTTYLFSYNEASNMLTEVADLGFMNIGGNQVNLIYKDNYIYLGNSQGLYKMNLTDHTNSVPVTHYDSTTTPNLPFDSVNDLQFDANNDLWLANRGTYDAAIVKFNITSETYTSYQLPTPNNAASNIRFNKLALDETGLIWAVGQNYGGLVKLTIENSTPAWTFVPQTELATLGFPVTYTPNNIYFRNNKFYFTITDGSSGSNSNYEVIINDNDVWSGRNDNEEGNLSNIMTKRFHENLSDENGGVWWFNRFEDIVVYRDSEDNHLTIDLQNLSTAAVIDNDNKAIVRGGSPGEIRKIDFPNAISIQENANQATDMKRYGNQVWILDHSNKKIDVYEDDAFLTSYDLGEDWYQQAYYFAVDDNGDAWFMRYINSLEVKKFNTTTLISTTYDLSALGSINTLRKIVAAPNGGVWFLSKTAAIYQEAGVFYDFKATDYTELYNLVDIVADTNGKAYLLNNDTASITTIENPTDANPIVANIVIEDNNSVMPSLNHYRPASLTIDSEGSVWTHASLNTFKLIDDDLATEYIPYPDVLNVETVELSADLSIYPNPVKNRINVVLNQPINRLQLFDVLGKRVADVRSSDSLDVSHLNSGLYVLKVNTETSVYTHKVLIN